MIPNLPRRLAPLVDVVEHLLVLEGIHSRPEAIVLVGQKLLLFNQSLKWLVK